jgi:hypothetical protein
VLLSLLVDGSELLEFVELLLVSLVVSLLVLLFVEGSWFVVLSGLVELSLLLLLVVSFLVLLVEEGSVVVVLLLLLSLVVVLVSLFDGGGGMNMIEELS